ncbi:N-acetylmuramoyl-L-alanine amidase [Paenibacillus sp. MMS20-IR301]|uniref:N-acetylmuramoyl-L-alanine amidase family protein n=1 Tax=Paenibacillus sp. MMS20-IR301 TaxID=2895946 RepID=UPI0028E64789|nr:N-acetylmuramoyl-L-alanine amidase [Paenibacillus sp. MMS20-IR301]WNS44669.1 N-acetylmuramoyl-L-alanine amidase [Paenibacillus sp. MMS20-IR301]
MWKRHKLTAGLLSLLVLLPFAACSSGSSNDSGGNSAEPKLSIAAAPAADSVAREPDRASEAADSKATSGTIYKVVIDPGHGGEDPGATSVSGRFEKEFNLSISLAVAAKLAQDPQIQLELTRTGDEFISSHELFRPEFANTLPADLFISIHGNTYEDESASGTETFYYHEDSQAFAETIHRHVIQATGLKDRGVKTENFYVLRDTEMPSALLELGYLTNPGDEAKMWTYSFQDAVAEAIVDGIKEYCSILERGEKPAASPAQREES